VGIIEEGQEVMKEYKGSPALDAGLLAAAQAVEHYEISRYGTLKTWAQELGLEEAVELLDTTLAEEKKTDELLTEIAESWRCVSSGRGPAPTWSDVRDLVVSGESGDEPDINESTRLTDVGHQQVPQRTPLSIGRGALLRSVRIGNLHRRRQDREQTTRHRAL
jgi:hypothetical protein